jgi:hypothetical protein
MLKVYGFEKLKAQHLYRIERLLEQLGCLELLRSVEGFFGAG